MNLRLLMPKKILNSSKTSIKEIALRVEVIKPKISLSKIFDITEKII